MTPNILINRNDLSNGRRVSLILKLIGMNAPSEDEARNVLAFQSGEVASGETTSRTAPWGASQRDPLGSSLSGAVP
jgi:hypothetical protein